MPTRLEEADDLVKRIGQFKKNWVLSDDEVAEALRQGALDVPSSKSLEDAFDEGWDACEEAATLEFGRSRNPYTRPQPGR